MKLQDHFCFQTVKMEFSQHCSPVLSVEKCIKTISQQKSFYVDITHFFGKKKKFCGTIPNQL